MSAWAEFSGGITESVEGGNWVPSNGSDLSTMDAAYADWQTDEIEYRLAAQAQATGNAHSVTGNHQMGRIMNHG